MVSMMVGTGRRAAVMSLRLAAMASVVWLLLASCACAQGTVDRMPAQPEGGAGVTAGATAAGASNDVTALIREREELMRRLRERGVANSKLRAEALRTDPELIRMSKELTDREREVVRLRAEIENRIATYPRMEAGRTAQEADLARMRALQDRLRAVAPAEAGTAYRSVPTNAAALRRVPRGP
jgi:hypothetical protein